MLFSAKSPRSQTEETVSGDDQKEPAVFSMCLAREEVDDLCQEVAGLVESGTCALCIQPLLPAGASL